jgi:predicted nucleic acid-binding protein
MRLVVDASALAAMTFGEPEAARITESLDGAEVFAPTLLKYELASVARKKIRAHPGEASRVIAALTTTLEAPNLTWCDVDPADVILTAHATGLTTYDASYLWLAGSLGADLVTLDRKLAGAEA